MTASIGPAYADYRQLFIENSVTGNYSASETQSDLAGALGEVGISKKMHLSHFMDLLMLLKCSDEAAIEAANTALVRLSSTFVELMVVIISMCTKTKENDQSLYKEWR